MKGTVFAALALICASTSAHAQPDRYEALANSPMVEGRPTSETSRLLEDELLFQRATQTYLWALPLINTLGMKIGSEKAFGAGYNVLPVWKKRLDAKTLVTAPNSDVIYAMSYLDVGKDGPMVFEAPPACKASCSTSGSAQSRGRRSTGVRSPATSGCRDLTPVKAASS